MSGVLENSREALGLEWSEPAEERAPKRWRAKLCEHRGPPWGWSRLTVSYGGRELWDSFEFRSGVLYELHLQGSATDPRTQ